MTVQQLLDELSNIQFLMDADETYPVINGCGVAFDQLELEHKGHVGVTTGYYTKISKCIFFTEHVMLLKDGHTVPHVALLSGCTQILLEVKRGIFFDLEFL